MKKLIPLIAGAALALAAAFYWMASPSTGADPNVIATNGIHWHSKIEIYVDGVRKEIPGNIGIGPAFTRASGFDAGMDMTALHTHAPDGIVHMEFSGTVYRKDITLGAFFRVWGKTFDSFGSKLRMKVNGADNSEGENYVMRDKDQIVLSFFK